MRFDYKKIIQINISIQKIKSIMASYFNGIGLVLLFYFIQLVISQDNTCVLQGALSCNASSYCPPNTKIINSLKNTTYNCSDQPLSLTADVLNIEGTFSFLNLKGINISISNLNVVGNLTILHQNYIQFMELVSVGLFLSSDVYGVYGNSSQLSIYFNAAAISAKRMVFQTFGEINSVNSTFDTIGSVCIYNSMKLDGYSKKIWDGYFLNISNLFSQSVSFGLISLGSIKIINNSQISSTIITIISQQNINITQSEVVASAKSCRTNMGPGRGLVVQIKDNFCYSGSTGSGYGLMSDPSCSSILEYFMFLTHSFPYMLRGATLSAGSGGYGYNNFKNSQKGAGGGIIYIFAKQTLYIQSVDLQASGGNVLEDDLLSAGSGGTIYMYSEYLSGNQSTISAAGGASFNNRGAGSGGMVKILFQQIQKQHHGIIWINVSQGYQPSQPQMNIQSNGNFYGPICPIGKVRWYLGCQTCPSNTYNLIANQYCLQCPRSANFNWNSNAIGIQNPWDCFLSQQQSPYYLWIVPGQIDIVSISCYIGLLIAFVIFGVIVRRQLKKLKVQNDDIDIIFETIKKDMKQAKILTEKLKSQKSIQPYQLMYHIHRITVAGSNTYLCPWVLPLIPPQVVKKYVLLQAYQNFARKFNKLSQWSKFEIFLTKILYLIYPLHWLYYDTVKKRKYRRLCKLLQESRQYNLINNFQFEDKDLITLKFSKNKDYTSCYIDFFFYQRSDLSYYNLSVPFIIYLSGEGNFIRPFYIEQNDPFVKAMTLIVSRGTYLNNQNQVKQNSLMGHAFTNDKQKLLRNLVNLNLRKKNQSQLKKFIINFNAISCTLDLSAPIKIFIKTLSILIDYINTWNKKFFNKVKVQIDLILMISDLQEQNIVSSSIHILSNKNQQFLNKVKAIIPRMNLNNQIDLKIGLFIYNPDQEIDTKQIKQPHMLSRQTILSGQIGRSEDDIDDNEISEHLLQDEKKNASKKGISSLESKLTRYLCLFRYFMLSHQITSKDRYTIKLLQSYLILTQTALVFVWSIKIEIPYFFINLIAPFIGIIWMVSDSYGFGKLFLIFNAMNLLNELVTLLFFSLAEQSNQPNLIKIIVCQIINLILVILNMQVGSRSLTFSKKLKNID